MVPCLCKTASIPLANCSRPARAGCSWAIAAGGCIDDDRKLGTRRWTSRQWICCKLDFNNRHRKVWGDSYSELFFLDEVTAFAAGHRPCFECRRKDAEHFRHAVRAQAATRDRAAAMDEVLHAERLDGKAKRLHRRRIDNLPDGAMIALGGDAFAVRGKRLLRWTPSGYAPRAAAPARNASRRAHAAVDPRGAGRGYTPLWHPSSG